MDLIRIYECLCDRTRLRLLALLVGGPLCVCHLQAVLGEPQVKVSKHLAYLRERGLVKAKREGSWMVYRLPEKPSRELAANLACLQDCAAEDPVFRQDRARLERLAPAVPGAGACGCARNGSPALTQTAGTRFRLRSKLRRTGARDLSSAGSAREEADEGIALKQAPATERLTASLFMSEGVVHCIIAAPSGPGPRSPT